MRKSKWSQGVDEYAEELRENAGEGFPSGNKITEEMMLNGARDWKEYSWGGNSYIYDQDIAKTLATPSEIKKVTRKDGSLGRPNKNEDWLDTQARALFQASNRVLRQEANARRNAKRQQNIYRQQKQNARSRRRSL